MNESILESLLRRDRILVLAALGALTVLAWAYVLWLFAAMPMAAIPSMPDMPGMVMAPQIKPLSLTGFLFTFAMWTVMMVGMMTPSAAPMILLYAQVGRRALAERTPFAATFWFVHGYLLAWTGFAAAASVAQVGLANAALITPMLASANNFFGGIVLLAAGLYQWTFVKDACLWQCQSPIDFLRRHGGFKRVPAASLRLGFRHGLFCVGCCWALMALLFVGGVMNVLWIAGLSILVLIEKLLPAGRIVPRTAGLVLVAGGLIFLYRTTM